MTEYEPPLSEIPPEAALAVSDFMCQTAYWTAYQRATFRFLESSLDEDQKSAMDAGIEYEIATNLRSLYDHIYAISQNRALKLRLPTGEIHPIFGFSYSTETGSYHAHILHGQGEREQIPISDFSSFLLGEMRPPQARHTGPDYT